MKKLLFVLSIIMCLLATSSNAQDKRLICKGKSKSGVACKSTIVSKKLGFCNAHNPNRPHCSAKNSKGEPCGVMPVKNSTKCRHHNI